MTHRLRRTEGTWPCWAHCERLEQTPPPRGHRNGLKWEFVMITLISDIWPCPVCWGECPRTSCSPAGPPPPQAVDCHIAWRRRLPCSGVDWASLCVLAADPRCSVRWSAPGEDLRGIHLNGEREDDGSPFSMKLRMYPRCSSETTSLFHLSCFSRRLFKV